MARQIATIQNKAANSNVGPLFLSMIGAGAPLAVHGDFFSTMMQHDRQIAVYDLAIGRKRQLKDFRAWDRLQSRLRLARPSALMRGGNG